MKELLSWPDYKGGDLACAVVDTTLWVVESGQSIAFTYNLSPTTSMMEDIHLGSEPPGSELLRQEYSLNVTVGTAPRLVSNSAGLFLVG